MGQSVDVAYRKRHLAQRLDYVFKPSIHPTNPSSRQFLPRVDYHTGGGAVSSLWRRPNVRCGSGAVLTIRPESGRIAQQRQVGPPAPFSAQRSWRRNNPSLSERGRYACIGLTNIYLIQLMSLVAYTRVSTGKQQASGLGLEAQQEAIEQYAKRTGLPIIGQFTEVESGAVRDRPQLAAALEMCRRKKAVLLIARLDRLSRSLAFIAQLLEAGVDVRAADVPEANRLTLQLLAVFAEYERGMIRDRTKAALAAAKARGVRLGVHGAVLAAEQCPSAHAKTRNHRGREQTQPQTAP